MGAGSTMYSTIAFATAVAPAEAVYGYYEGFVALSRSAMVGVPPVRAIFDDDDPERRCKRGAQATALPKGRRYS